MLNIFFSLFLLGMLIVLCGKAISRAMHQQQPLNSKEAALLSTKPSCFSTEKGAARLPQMRQLFSLRKKEADSRLLPRCLPLMLLFCFTFCRRNPH